MFCIYVKDEEEKYKVKISKNGVVKLFAEKQAAYDYALTVGLKTFVVKPEDWEFGR